VCLKTWRRVIRGSAKVPPEGKRRFWGFGSQRLRAGLVLSRLRRLHARHCSQTYDVLLLLLKYHHSVSDAMADLGRPEEIGMVFAGFQKYLYQPAG
jgi:hypothetical protein